MGANMSYGCHRLRLHVMVMKSLIIIIDTTRDY